MKKELKDYLHLYLGCKGTANVLYKHETLNSVVPIPNTILCVVTTVGFIKVQCYDKNGVAWQELHVIKAEDFKPILRPLSDMDKEDVIDVFKVNCLYDLSECDFDCAYDIEDGWYCNALKGGSVIDTLKFDGNIFWAISNDGRCEPLNPQCNATKMLLSKFFDLFNLIESGLAIDASTLKQKA